jgi:hypothetical protein
LVIIGAGFGGMKLMQELKADYNIVMVDPKDCWEYFPNMSKCMVGDESEIEKTLVDYRTMSKVPFIKGYACHMTENQLTCRVYNFSETETILKNNGWNFLSSTEFNELDFDNIHISGVYDAYPTRGFKPTMNKSNIETKDINWLKHHDVNFLPLANEIKISPNRTIAPSLV